MPETNSRRPRLGEHPWHHRSGLVAAGSAALLEDQPIVTRTLARFTAGGGIPAAGRSRGMPAGSTSLLAISCGAAVLRARSDTGSALAVPAIATRCGEWMPHRVDVTDRSLAMMPAPRLPVT